MWIKSVQFLLYEPLWPLCEMLLVDLHNPDISVLMWKKEKDK